VSEQRRAELEALAEAVVTEIMHAVPLTIHPFYPGHTPYDWQGMALLIREMERRGFWCQMRTAFDPAHPGAYGYGLSCFAGFTPHSTSGWNGTPDHWTDAPTLPEAVCRAALACVRQLKEREAA